MSEINKGKGKKPSSLSVHYNTRTEHHHYYRNQNKPLAADARVEAPGNPAAGGGAPAMPDASKSGPAVIGTGRDRIAALRPPKPSSPAIGNPVAQGYQNRLSESRVDQSRQSALSNGDHNPGAGRNPGLAIGHLDLRQSHATFSDATVNLHTERGNVVDLGIPDTTSGGFSHAGRVSMGVFNAREGAGTFDGMNQVNPNPLRPADHQHRDSATADNGSHTASGFVQSSAVGNKAVSPPSNHPLELMKRAMRGEL